MSWIERYKAKLETPAQAVGRIQSGVRVDGTFNGVPIGWRSSLSREDTGDQSCEVFYVERLRVGDDVYL